MTFEVKSPILGFEDITKVELTKVDEFFSSLKNAENPVPAFTLANPYALREYSFDVPSDIKVLLELKDNSKIEVHCVVVLQNPIEKSVVNFIAPLIFNLDNGKMAQAVLDVREYMCYGVAEEIEPFLKKD
jgi:flagellar assembly factor FliW